MASAILPSEILLLVLNECDVQTANSMCAIPVLGSLVQRYARSIIKTIVSPHLDGAVMEGKHMMWYDVDPTKHDFQQPQIVPTISWEALTVLKRREAWVARLLAPGGRFLEGRTDNVWRGLSGEAERQALLAMAREGLWFCDQMSDLEAGVIAGCDSANNFATAGVAGRSVEHTVAEQQWLRRPPTLARGAERSRRQMLKMRENCLRWEVRRERGHYIRQLETRQLLCIMLVLRLTQNHQQFPAFDPAMERGMREAVLRHGSWLLIMLLMKPAEPRRGHPCHLKQLISSGGKRESFTWQGETEEETGVTLEQELGRRLKRDGERINDNVQLEAMLRVDEMIRGEQRARPVTFLFAHEERAPIISDASVEWLG
ncbi:hypothetical protein CDD83_3757 [Cordyceps sp. RAO-2017]|nr:hypothetical protein CDD83_3757 [Cordyceps sp. RAO-2017]